MDDLREKVELNERKIDTMTRSLSQAAGVEVTEVLERMRVEAGALVDAVEIFLRRCWIFQKIRTTLVSIWTSACGG